MNERRCGWHYDSKVVNVGTLTGLMTDGTNSEPQKAFIVAGAVLLGLPFILMLGMGAIVMAAAVGYIPGATSGLPSELTSELLLFFLGWSAVSVVAVLIFVAFVMKRSSGEPPR